MKGLYMTYNIAIDGPAGAGKSTIARLVAKELSFIYVDTGAMYRAMAYYLTCQGLTPQTISQADMASLCRGADITINYQDGVQIVLLNGENVNPYLRTEATGNMASACAALPEVRAHLLNLQRSLAARNNVVMDGRDIGTTILPNAQVKIYLTASSEIRARRRCREYQENNIPYDFDQVKADIEERDYRDTHRSVSPLSQAPDAILVDSSDMTIDQVVQTIMKIAESHK